MAYSVQPSTPDDVPESLAVAEKSYADLNHFLYHTFPLSQESINLMTRTRVEAFQTSPHTSFYKAVDSESGAMIGYVKWSVHPEGLPIDKTVEEVVEARLTPRIPEVRDRVVRELYRHMNRDMRDIMRDGEAGEDENGEVKKLVPHVHLDALFTHPDHQRKGVARALMRDCLAKADALGLPFFLEATQDGKPVYDKLGFETVGVFSLEAEKYGGIGRHDITYMKRLPKTSTPIAPE